MKQMIFITAPWCALCKQLKPIAMSIASKHNIKVKMLDMILHEAECSKYLPTSLPFIVYGDKALAGGACNKNSIEALITEGKK